MGQVIKREQKLTGATSKVTDGN